MTKPISKRFLDFVPLFILVVSALSLLWTVITTDIALQWKHTVGFCCLAINCILFRCHHKAGVLFLGLNLFVGSFGFLSFSPAITSITFNIGNPADSEGFNLRWQPIFLLWLLVHFILSARHYVGILSTAYWRDLVSHKK